ncbi:hypothetical protein V6N13_028127 [Hibiscus sabdariffa]
MHQNRKKRGNVYVMVRVGCNDELAEPPTGAIDLVGSFNNQPRGTFALSRLSDRTSRPDFLHSWSFFEKFLFEVYNGAWDLYMLQIISLHDSLKFERRPCNLYLRKCYSPPGFLMINNFFLQPHVVTLRNSGENLPTPVAVQSKLKFPSTQLGLIPVPGVRGCMICTWHVKISSHRYKVNKALGYPCTRDMSHAPIQPTHQHTHHEGGGTAIVSLGFHGYRLNEWKRAV